VSVVAFTWPNCDTPTLNMTLTNNYRHKIIIVIVIDLYLK